MITRITIIGGFGFNFKPLKCLEQLGANTFDVTHRIVFDFVDINLFKAPFTLDDIVNFITSTFMANEAKITTQMQSLYPITIAVAKNKVDKNCITNNILIGYSTGGLIASAIGLKYPELVRQIILINSTAKFIQGNNWNGITADDFKQLQNRLDKNHPAQFMHYFTLLSVYPKKVKFNSYASWYSNNNKGTLRNLLEIIFYTDFRQELMKLKNKLTLINSLDDILVKKNDLPLKQIMLDKSSHLILNQNLLIDRLRELLHLE